MSIPKTIIMVVNSISFWIFFVIVLLAYYGLFRKTAKLQNLTLLISSYIFYGMVDWKMCALLLAASVSFYYIGSAIGRYNGTNEKTASRLTTLGVLLGMGMLFYFKYFDFFVGQFSNLLYAIGIQNNINTFGILMPLGISFFTFKLIAYVIEVHRETMEPSKDPIAFGTYIAFFPTIMSGPIDHPGKFLPQLSQARNYNIENVTEGTKRIIWGLFLKMCIADQLSGYTSAVLGNYSHHNASSIIFAAVLYYFQMYTDFAGYSDMAIGVGRIMGIRIAENFNRPIFAQNISEYWRRWHISLTSWITQYIYMPLNLAFRNLGKMGICLAAIINTIAIGAWHGANWTYIFFGIYHGVIIALITLIEKRRKKFEKIYNLKNNAVYKFSRMLITFVLVVIGMIVFQATSLHAAFGIVYFAVKNGFGELFTNESFGIFVLTIPFIILVLFKEYKEENNLDLHFFHSKNSYVEILSVLAMLLLISLTGNLNGGTYIYFQF